MIREAFPDIQIIAGNIATGEACKALIEAGDWAEFSRRASAFCAVVKKVRG